MTSNIGSRELKDFGGGVGFNTSSISKEHSHGIISKALNQRFSPEFLNRLDDIIMFDSLDKESIFKIIDIELATFYKRVSELGFSLEITNEAKEFLAEKGYDKQYGARPLKRAIQSYIEDELAEILLKGDAKTGDIIFVSISQDKDKLTTVIK